MNESVSVRGSDDFAGVAQLAYRRVGQAGGGSLDVAVEPGEYRGAALMLDDVSAGPVNVRVHAADARRPPRLVDAPVSLSGPSVQVEHLLFEGTVADRPLLRVAAGNGIELDGCAFLGNTLGTFTSGGAMIELSPGSVGPSSVPQVTIRNGWFVGNRSDRQWCLLRVPASPPAFGRVRIHTVALADNVGLAAVGTGGTRVVECDECWLESPAPLFVLFFAGTELLIQRSHLIGPSLEELVQFGPANFYAAPILKESWLHLNNQSLDSERFDLEATEVLGPLGRWRPAPLLDRARQGLPPDLAAMRHSYVEHG